MTATGNVQATLIGEGGVRKWDALVQSLKGEGEWLLPTASREWLACYARDAQSLLSTPPLCVFKPRDRKALVRFASVCHDLERPYTVRGGGTGLAGGAIPSRGGVVLLTSHLKDVLHYAADEGKVVVEAGCTPRRLNALVADDGWELPLFMESGGVATLGGCLTTQAMTESFVQAHVVDLRLVDGAGQERPVSPLLVRGTEGCLGTVVEVTLRLRRKRTRRTFTFTLPWEEAISWVDHPATTDLCWDGNSFRLQWEGEEWREPPPFPPGDPFASLWSHIPAGHPFLCFGSSAPLAHLRVLADTASQLADHFGLHLRLKGELLREELRLLLFASLETAAFTQKIEAFLEEWVNRLSQKEGHLVGFAGLGQFFSPYLPPFWGESFSAYLIELKKRFDPKGLLSPDHWLPRSGKCVEKRWQS